jgi:long-chain acyl-CoA synthetase
MEGGRVMDVTQLARWGAFQRGRGAESLPGLDCTESDPAIIVHTPGTSGEPKGVVLSHGALLYSIRTLSHVLPVGPEDVQLLFLPLSHVLGLVSLLASHASGTPAALGNGVRSLLEDLRDIRPTYMVGVPRVYEKIVEKIDSIASEFGFLAKEGYRRGLAAGRQATRLREDGKRPDLETRLVLDVARRSVFQRFRDLFGGRMRFVISGGAPLSQEVGLTLEALGIPVLEGFGLTETSGATHINRLEHRRIGSVGAPLPLVDTRVAQDGEILVKSPGLMTEYFGDPDGTRAVFDDGWFHTGDIGVVEAGGILRITGRKKNLIVTATGENVVPARMEEALEQIPVVSRAVVVGDLHSYLVALLTLNERAVDRWATDRGLEEAPVPDLRTHPDLYQMIEKEIQRINPGFAPHERVRRFAILDRDFSQEQGELTEDLKVRRSVVLERFGDLIAMLYEDRI